MKIDESNGSSSLMQVGNDVYKFDLMQAVMLVFHILSVQNSSIYMILWSAHRGFHSDLKNTKTFVENHFNLKTISKFFALMHKLV